MRSCPLAHTYMAPLPICLLGVVWPACPQGRVNVGKVDGGNNKALNKRFGVKVRVRRQKNWCSRDIAIRVTHIHNILSSLLLPLLSLPVLTPPLLLATKRRAVNRLRRVTSHEALSDPTALQCTGMVVVSAAAGRCEDVGV